MIGGSDKCERGLSGLVAAFSAFGEAGQSTSHLGTFSGKMPGALSCELHLMCSLPVLCAPLSILGNQMPLRITPPSSQRSHGERCAVTNVSDWLLGEQRVQ